MNNLDHQVFVFADIMLESFVLEASSVCVFSFSCIFKIVVQEKLIYCFMQLDDAMLVRKVIEEQCEIPAPSEVFNILIDGCCKLGQVGHQPEMDWGVFIQGTRESVQTPKY